MNAQVIYTPTQLMGTPRKHVIRLVEQAGLTWHRTGRKRYIFLSQLKAALPEVWDSLVASREVAHLIG